MFVKFNYIEFRNFLSYPSKPTRLTFESGLHLITGDNGAGKSSIATDALSYVLFGKPYRKIKIDELISRVNRKDMLVECEFQVGNDTYLIKRGLKPSKLVIMKNGVDELESLSSKNLTQDQIDMLLGVDYKMFRNIISFAASANKPFFELSSQEKRDIIEAIFNVNMFGDMLKILKKNIANVKVDIDLLSNSISFMRQSVEDIEKRYLEIEQNKKDFYLQKKSDIEYYSLQLTQLNEKLIQLNDETCKKTLQVKEFMESKQNRIVKINESIAVRKKLISEELNLFKVNIAKQLLEIDAEIAKLNNRIELIETEFKNKQTEINNTIVEVKSQKAIDIDKKKLTIQKAIELSKTKKDEYLLEIKNEGTNLDISGLDVLKDQYSKQINEFEMLIDQTRKKILFYNTNDICQECDTIITEEMKQTKLADYEKSLIDYESGLIQTNIEIGKIKKRIEDVTAKRDRISSIQRNIDRLENATEKKLSELKSELQVLETDLTDENKLLHKLDILQFERDSLVKDVETQIKDLQNSKSSFDVKLSLKEQSLNNDEEIRKLNSELESLITDKTSNFILSEIEAIKTNIKQVNDDVVGINEKLSQVNLRQFTIDIDKVLTEKTQKKDNLDKIELQLSEKQQLFDDYGITKEILSENGIKAFFFKRLIPILNQKINMYLSRFQLPITIEFDESMSERITTLDSCGEEVNYNSFSGGERKRIDMSILFSFIDVNKTITNWSTNVLIVDELLDSGVDKSGLDDLIKTLKDMAESSNYMSIYIISHKIENVGYFDNVLNVKKNGRFSEIT